MSFFSGRTRNGPIMGKRRRLALEPLECGDGFAEIITGAGPAGGRHVEAFSGRNLSVLMSFYAYAPAVPFGVNVAADDMGGDDGGIPGGIGNAEIVTGAEAGGGPHVKVFD